MTASSECFPAGSPRVKTGSDQSLFYIGSGWNLVNLILCLSDYEAHSTSALLCVSLLENNQLSSLVVHTIQTTTNVIDNAYTRQEARIIWYSCKSQYCIVKNGIKRGVISPIHYRESYYICF